MLAITTTFGSCVDDNEDTEIPFLKVSPTSLTFNTNGSATDGSQDFFEISTNRHWKATIKDDKTWVTLSKTEGDGNATIGVSIPENINDKATVIIEISNSVGTLMSETVTIVSGTPADENAIVIPELVQKAIQAGSTQTVIDANKDRIFYGVVQCDTLGGNFTKNNLPVALENADAAGQGITLYGSQVDARTIKATKGDKIKVTLHKGLAKVVNYQGLYEVTGGVNDIWATVEKVGTATITPLVITADKLAEYQGMTVTIKNATTATGGTWTSGTNEFNVAGTPFNVFCQTNATAFVGQSFAPATGDITGVATVYKSASQLVPRNMDDVVAFKVSSPTITQVAPNTLAFAATGETKTIEVTVVNQGSNSLSVSGLSGTLSASVNNTTVTVVAAANTGGAISQTLTITLQNGNSVEVPVTQAAKPTGGENTVIMTLQDLIDGKTSAADLPAGNYGTGTSAQVIATPDTWYAWSKTGLNFTGVKICKYPATNSTSIQVQGDASDITKQGRIANVTPLGTIKSIELVSRSATTYSTPSPYNMYAGTAANPGSSNTTITPTTTGPTLTADGKFNIFTQTFDFSGGTYSYFTIMNDLKGVLYIDSIKITYQN